MVRRSVSGSPKSPQGDAAFVEKLRCPSHRLLHYHCIDDFGNGDNDGNDWFEIWRARSLPGVPRASCHVFAAKSLPRFSSCPVLMHFIENTMERVKQVAAKSTCDQARFPLSSFIAKPPAEFKSENTMARVKQVAAKPTCDQARLPLSSFTAKSAVEFKSENIMERVQQVAAKPGCHQTEG